MSIPGSPRNRPGVLSLSLLIPLVFCTEPMTAQGAYFDTAWTYTYDGGLASDGKAIPDIFNDVTVLPNGNSILIGDTRDSAFGNVALMVELSPAGRLEQKRLLWLPKGLGASSLLAAAHREYFVGGNRFGSPVLLRLDSQFTLKSSFWYFDSVGNRSLFPNHATLQSMVRTSNGRIFAVGGDILPYNNGFNGSSIGNYAVMMEFDSLGASKTRSRQWLDAVPFEVAGWSVIETGTGRMMMAGNMATVLIDDAGMDDKMTRYRFHLEAAGTLGGYGTVTNKVSRVRKLRNGNLIAVGQAYEADCWTRYQRLSYDGWWSFITDAGIKESWNDGSWNTAGISGSHDSLFDVAQLTDNRLAFVGLKGTLPDSGLWVFVTDSTAKTILWEGQFDLPGNEGTSGRRFLGRYTLAATPDTGFIVAGMVESGHQAGNALAVKFMPARRPLSIRPSIRGGSLVMNGSANTLTFEVTRPGRIDFKVYTLQGRVIQMESKVVGKPGPVAFAFRHGGDKNQVVLWEIRTVNQHKQGKFFLNRQTE